MEELLSHVSVMKGISYFLGIKFFMCAFFCIVLSLAVRV